MVLLEDIVIEIRPVLTKEMAGGLLISTAKSTAISRKCFSKVNINGIMAYWMIVRLKAVVGDKVWNGNNYFKIHINCILTQEVRIKADFYIPSEIQTKLTERLH